MDQVKHLHSGVFISTTTSEIGEMGNSTDGAAVIDDFIVTTNGFLTGEIANNASVKLDGFGAYKSVSAHGSLVALVVLLLLLGVLIAHSISSVTGYRRRWFDKIPILVIFNIFYRIRLRDNLHGKTRPSCENEKSLINV